MRSCDLSTARSLLNCCLLSGLLCSRLWLWFPTRRRSFPVAVTLYFFFAPEFVFCFGISFDSCVLGRCKHHRHVAAFEERLDLDRPNLLDVVGEPHQQVSSAVRMLAFAAPEHDRDLHLRPLVQKADDVALLGLVVVNSNLGSELDLLDEDLRLVLPCRLRLLFLLIAVLPEVHHLGHGRIRACSDLDQVEALAIGVRTRLFRRLDPELLPFLADQTYPGDTNRIVDSRLGFRTARGLKGASPRPQIAVTKLCLSSFANEKPVDRQRQTPNSTHLVEPPKAVGREVRNGTPLLARGEA